MTTLARRNVLGLSIAAGIGAIGVAVGVKRQTAKPNHLRPPGALPEGEFE